MMNLSSLIILCEVGLRGSLQNEKTLPSTEDKLELLRGFIDAGLTVIELGSFMHSKAVSQIVDTDELYRKIGDVSDVELQALVPNLRGVQHAVTYGCKEVKLNIFANRQHDLRNLNMLPEESVMGFASYVEAARESGIAISGSISVPFASPWEGHVSLSDVDVVIKAYLEIGVTEVSLSGTSGMVIPNQVYNMCARVRKAYPQVSWQLHLHNTHGLAMTSILASMEAGMVQFDSSFRGLGDCPFVPGAAGNIPMKGVIHMCDKPGIVTGIDLVKITPLLRGLQQLLGHDTDSYVLYIGRSRDLIQPQSN